MKKRVSKFFLKNLHFKREFRRELRLLIVVTLGFTIAFTWRQTIFDIFLSLVRFFTHIKNDIALSILASSLITFVSIGLIYLTSYLLRESYENY